MNEGVVGTEPWTDAHHRAATVVAERLRDRVRTTFVEAVDSTSARDVVDDLVADGHRMVFATSQALEPAVLEAASDHEGVAFATARGRSIGPNVATFAIREDGPLFLAGYVAGAEASATSGLVGLVAMHPEDETRRYAAALARGVRAACPRCALLPRWVESWWDPDAETALGADLVDEGVAVLVSGSIGPALGALAREHGLGWVAHGADRSREAPENWLTASIPDWTAYYLLQVEQLLAGTWRPARFEGGMAGGFASLAPLGSRVPDRVRREVRLLRSTMAPPVPARSSGFGPDQHPAVP